MSLSSRPGQSRRWRCSGNSRCTASETDTVRQTPNRHRQRPEARRRKNIACSNDLVAPTQIRIRVMILRAACQTSDRRNRYRGYEDQVVCRPRFRRSYTTRRHRSLSEKTRAQHSAVTIGRNRLLEPSPLGPKSHAHCRHEKSLRFGACANHRVSIRRSPRHRLFAQYMLSGCERGFDDFRMKRRRHADIDDIHVTHGNKFTPTSCANYLRKIYLLGPFSSCPRSADITFGPSDAFISHRHYCRAIPAARVGRQCVWPMNPKPIIPTRTMTHLRSMNVARTLLPRGLRITTRAKSRD